MEQEYNIGINIPGANVSHVFFEQDLNQIDRTFENKNTTWLSLNYAETHHWQQAQKSLVPSTASPLTSSIKAPL